MLIRGFIQFGRTQWSQDSGNSASIRWNSGIIEYPVISNQKFFPETNVIGFEGYHQNDVKVWGSNTRSLASFYDFKAFLQSSENRLGIGVWYQEAENTLHLARSLFGTYPLYYLFVRGQHCLFSTDLHAILKSARVVETRVSLNKARLQSFLTFGNDHFRDYDSETFYNEIRCVLPGHMLSITPEGCTSSPYSKFRLPQDNNSLPEYATRFKTLLEDAVRRYIPSDGSPIGSHLSGGLDSSSVSTFSKILAPESPLHTFYYDTQGAGSDDFEFAREIARNIGSVHHDIALSDDQLTAVVSHTRILGYPQPAFVPPTFYDGVFKLAREFQCQTVLNGSGGDSIVGSGLEYPALLYRQKNWPLLKEVLSGRTQFFSKADQFRNWDRLTPEQKNAIVQQNFLYSRLSSAVRTMSISQLIALYRQLSTHFDLTPGYFAKRAFLGFVKKLQGYDLPPLTLLRQDVLETVGEATSQQSKMLSTSLRGDLPNELQQSFEDIYNHHTISQNENRFIFGRHYGFHSRSPFFDKPLFELCMPVPEIIKFGNGIGRMHFREAMKGILPDKVRLRAQKAHIGRRGKSVTLQLFEQAREMLYDGKEIWHYIDRDQFEKTVKFLQTDHLPMANYNRSLFHVTRTVSVAAWFEWLKSEKILD
jgi:asparagine synthase (glutamine-hydrolysing)